MAAKLGRALQNHSVSAPKLIKELFFLNTVSDLVLNENVLITSKAPSPIHLDNVLSKVSENQVCSEVFYSDSDLRVQSKEGRFSYAGLIFAIHKKKGGLFSCTLNTKSDFELNCLEASRLLLSAQNAGGSSEMSEALSFEVFSRLLGADDLTMEMDVKYYPLNSKKTDYVCTMLGKR